MRPEQIDEHVRRLNIVRDEYLSTEWEVGLLNAFSKVGAVQHEPDLGGKRLVDLLFRSPANAFEFVADIVTVSDQQLHKRNPVYALWQELERQVRKRQVKSGGFGLKVGHYPEATIGRNVRHNLMLPPIGKFHEDIFNAQFEIFITEVKRSPAIAHEYSVRNATNAVTIRYEPNTTGTWTSSHLSYTCANVIDDNPVFNALKEKARQLKASNYRGPRGIIVCDGGCRMLTNRMNSWAEYKLDQVVSEFFRQHHSVASVAIIGLRHDSSPGVGRGRYHPELSIGINPQFRGIHEPMRATMERMLAHLPVVETSGENALGRVKAKVPWGAHFGGLTMTGDKRIKLSAITVLQLLAGKLDYNAFARAHGFDEKVPNLFARALVRGRVIARCSIEQTPDEDDDWITFEFSESDTAIAPFRSAAAEGLK